MSLTIPAGRTCRLSGEAARPLPRLTFAARSSILELPLPEGMDSIPERYLTGMGASGTLVVEGSFAQTTPITIGAEGAPGTLELEYGGDVSLAPAPPPRCAWRRPARPRWGRSAWTPRRAWWTSGAARCAARARWRGWPPARIPKSWWTVT